MPTSLANEIAHSVVGRYPLVLREEPAEQLGNAGGFSGARLWRVRSGGADWVLKAWPEGGMKADRLKSIHQLMGEARRGGLGFVPDVMRTRTGETVCEHAGRVWDLTSLVPGLADFHALPGTARLENACAALAEIHGCWSRIAPSSGVCPGVRQRLNRYKKSEA